MRRLAWPWVVLGLGALGCTKQPSVAATRGPMQPTTVAIANWRALLAAADEGSEAQLIDGMRAALTRACSQRVGTAEKAQRYQRGCRSGSGQDCAKLGYMHLCGAAVPQDPRVAAGWFEEACARGEIHGCGARGLARMLGGADKVDVAREFATLERACEGGSEIACGTVGMALAQMNRPEALTRARNLLERACTLGNADACGNLAVVETTGQGGPKDHGRGFAHARTGCDGGSLFACSTLGLFYLNGFGVAEDHAAAVKLFTQGCEGGHPAGCANLAYCHQHGLGVARDDVRAMQLYRGACDRGVGAACRTLAEMMAAPSGSLQTT